MRSTRLTLAVTALSAALALTACSDDGGDEKESTGDAPAAADSEAPELRCGSAVKVSGTAEATWSGKAEPTQTSESGQAVYESRSKQGKLVVTSAGEGDEASVELTVGGTTYTASGDGVDAQEDGTGAEISVETSNADGAGPRLIASFVCYER